MWEYDFVALTDFGKVTEETILVTAKEKAMDGWEMLSVVYVPSSLGVLPHYKLFFKRLSPEYLHAVESTRAGQLAVKFSKDFNREMERASFR